MIKRAERKHSVPLFRRARSIASIGIGIAVVAVVGIGIGVFAGRSDPVETPAAAVGRTERDPDGAALPVVDVYKNPTCGCCAKWVEHLRDHGFTVRTADTTDLARLRASHGVPQHVASCHTALVDGYVLEGHVPAGDVQRLLEERPAIAGLAVPGMPTGSPGMEVPGVKAQPYNVMAFRTDGSTRVFATHN